MHWGVIEPVHVAPVMTPGGGFLHISPPGTSNMQKGRCRANHTGTLVLTANFLLFTGVDRVLEAKEPTPTPYKDPAAGLGIILRSTQVLVPDLHAKGPA